MSKSITNTMINLGNQHLVDEALYQLGLRIRKVEKRREKIHILHCRNKNFTVKQPFPAYKTFRTTRIVEN